ncbi:MAG TPA: hypothetical protein PKM35_06775 [Holophaga sp.]|nr:hypothetical protein [Holophaga sp.]HPS67460.1 hypothetical protein [Holophaga sp.]
MKRNGNHRGRALLVGSEAELRRTISRYLQLHGLEVVEAGTLQEAEGCLADTGDFDLLVTELMTAENEGWPEWKRVVSWNPRISLLLHGTHVDEWDRTRGKIGRNAIFIGRPFSLSDFHWVLQQVL